MLKIAFLIVYSYGSKFKKRVPKCESKTMVIKSLQKCDKHEKGEEGEVDSELED